MDGRERGVGELTKCLYHVQIAAWIRELRGSVIDQVKSLMTEVLNGPILLAAFALSPATLSGDGQGTPTEAAIGLNRLQGYWEAEEAGGNGSITITGNSLNYRTGTIWHKTTHYLPAPAHSGCTPPSKDAIGKVVFAIIKIEDRTLTLAFIDEPNKQPKSFADATTKYVVKRVQPKKEIAEPPKPK